LEINNIFRVVQFYAMRNRFGFRMIRDLLEFWDEFDWGRFVFEDKLAALTQIEAFRLYITEGAYDDSFIDSAFEDISFVTFHCLNDDYHEALSGIKNCMEAVCESLGVDCIFEIVEEKKGSWILTIMVIAACALILPKIFKRYADVWIEVNTKRKISRKLSDQLDSKSLGLKDLKLISDIAKSAGLVNISKENMDKVDLSDFSKMLEFVKIGI
jgi:hypothetical protein